MDRPKKSTRKGRKSPRVPLQTYKWEDVHRSRNRGGYPWTHLYKEPFDEELYPEDYTMDALRRSKSSSTFDRSERSDGVEIEEIFDDDRSNVSTVGSTKQYVEVAEPDMDSKSDRLAGEPEKSRMCTIESADSSDNISQYLDREEREKEGTSSRNENEERPPRAISEEPTRKRKLSGESSYSRLSLPKFAMLKKLSQQKLPKISFPSSKIKKTKVTKKASPPQVKKEIKQKTDYKNVKPVYIHIPLKPPPGETDEFSYLEFGEKVEPVIPKQSSFRNLVKAVKKEHDSRKTKEDDENKTDEGVEKMDFTLQEPEDEDKSKEIFAKCEIVDVKLKSPKDEKDVEMEPTQKLEEIIAEKLKENIANSDIDETEPESDMSSNHDHDIFEKLFEAGTTKTAEVPESTTSIKRDVRAKSAEPERKRKMSLESSYSRKSLSKLAFLKKMKDAKNKIKFPSLGNLFTKKVQKKEEKPTEIKEEKPVSTKKTKLEPKKPVEPVYIHIPLKPPEGQTDEFSYLENESTPTLNIEVKKVVEVEVEVESPNMSTPDSVQGSGVQFIFLTAPSDDEILDGPDVPETPSSENKFFGNRIEELKELAKDVVDEISPESRRKILAPVTEENSFEEFDKEDGLKITEAEAAKTEQIKSSIKPESSPLLKKKVSFKRRSKNDSKDGVYEEVIPKDEEEISKSSQSLSPEEIVQEEIAREEIIKEDIAQEVKVTEDEHPKDDTRWSKISDHEYEPVNPPPDEINPPQPAPKITDTHEEITVVTSDIRGSAPKSALKETHVTITTHETPLPTFASSLSSKGHPEEPKELEDKDGAPKESKFHSTLKLKAGQFKNKLQSIKKPNITLPKRPKFQKPNLQKFKLEKCKFNLPHLPKIPDTTRINLPSFGLTHRSTTKTTIKERQQSTESNVCDSKKHTFDFSTYPRFFKRKPKDVHDPSHITSSGETGRSKSVDRSVVPSGYEGSGESEANTGDAKKHFDFSNFSTFPRFFKKSRQETKISSSDSQPDQPLKRTRSADRVIIRIPLHSEESMENGYNLEKPDDDHVEDYGVDENVNAPSLIRYNEDIDIDDDYNRENVEIPDEGYRGRWDRGHFSNKVTDLDSPESINNQNESFDLSANTDPHSSQSSIDERRRGVIEEINSDEFFLRQKGISQDNIEVGKYLSSEIREAFKTPVNTLSEMQRDNYDTYNLGSNQSLPEVQMKKKPARKPKRKRTPHVSQEQIKYHDYDLEDNNEQPTRPKRTSSKSKNIDVLEERDIQEIMSRYASDSFEENKPYYENEKMRGKDQPNIYIDHGSEDYRVNYASGFSSREPEAPPRKHRSLKSLNLSEHDSILGDFSDKHVEQDVHSYIDEGYDDDNRYYKKYIEEPEIIPPVRPKRRSHSRKSSQNRNSAEISNILPEPEPAIEEPCVEEPCIKDLRDCMGYAIIDKSQNRDPPLPPPRTPPRRRRSLKSTSSERFSTVPRSAQDGPPTRPLRNYSTLGHIKAARKNSLKRESEKENIDITQYIELDDDANRNLVSGEIVQKMRDRPLPAPPRPPRKSRPLRDITSQQNIPLATQEQQKPTEVEEIDMSTQTEPLPDDFECEEIRHPDETTVVHERIIKTPTHYTYEEETITHGSLVVEPLNGAKILHDSEFTSIEKIIPVTIDSDDDYPSIVPESFKLLRDPGPAPVSREEEVRQAIGNNDTIQDLDVNRLRVNELLASKIVVAEIESDNIQVNQLSAKSGAIKLGDIELPPGVVQDLIKNAQVTRTEEDKYATVNKKDAVLLEENLKTSIEEVIPRTEVVEETVDHSIPVQADESVTDIESETNIPPTPPPRALESLRAQPDEMTPLRPPRQNKTAENSDAGTPLAEPDIDDYPPPRPPQPTVGYVPSQPPASFYALRAQKFVNTQNDDIPAAPRRRRHQRHVSRSSSEESLVHTPSRKHFRSPEPSIPQLTGQLIRACGSASNSALKRLIAYIRENVIRNEDGQQDLHVVIIMLLVLIAGLLLLGVGDEKTVVHLHHWEYFNPPKDM